MSESGRLQDTRGGTHGRHGDQGSGGDARGGRRFRVTRRGLLIGAGAAGAGLVVGAWLGRNTLYRAVAGYMAGNPTVGDTVQTDPALWFEVGTDDVVRLTVPKVEMGQGAHTALAQIAADELGAAWARIEVIQGGTNSGPADGMGTVGSASVSGLYEPLRTAAATLREMLATRAASLMGAERGVLEVADGSVRMRGDSATAMRFGEIVTATDAWPDLDEAPRLKSPDEFRFIGRPMPRIDFESKLRGEAVYGYDLRAEGMLYGAVARPPRIGSMMRGVDADAARAHPGVVDVVVDLEAQFAGVVANTRQQAWDAVEKLAIDWETPHVWTQDEIEALLDVSDDAGIPIQKDGSADRAIGEAPTLSAEYATPFAVHAHLEPQAALAEPVDGGLRMQVSTQMAGFTRDAVVAALGLSESSVTVVPAYLGGGFGRKSGVEPAVEAARLALAVRRPVHVGWNRAEDMQHGFFRPPTRSRFAARIENGRIEGLKHNHASGEVLFGFIPRALSYVIGPDPGAWRGAYGFYDGIANRVLSTATVRLPVPTGAWRGLGLLANTFTTESFMDEMAHAAGRDPLEFRLAHLGTGETQERFRVVLETMAERAGYGRALPEGRARGIACCIDVGTVVAMCVEISIDDSGMITVHRATQAVDAGRIVNPDGALAQAQGSIVMGLSSALIEEATVEDGRIVARNFDRYPLITLERTPEMDIAFIETDGPPMGMGEPSIGPVAAAVGNAVFNLTGKRLRRMPFTPERIRAATA